MPRMIIQSPRHRSYIIISNTYIYILYTYIGRHVQYMLFVLLFLDKMVKHNSILGVNITSPSYFGIETRPHRLSNPTVRRLTGVGTDLLLQEAASNQEASLTWFSLSWFYSVLRLSFLYIDLFVDLIFRSLGLSCLGMDFSRTDEIEP